MVMPTYNEEAIISKVLYEWIETFNNKLDYGVRWNIVVVDDGSRDSTRKILEGISKSVNADTRLRGSMVVLHQKNCGHGQACRTGYEKALQMGSDWIFQTDSDGQTSPSDFPVVWGAREESKAVMGWRIYREDGTFRKFATKVLRRKISRMTHSNIIDANVPFRLMRRDCLEAALAVIPETAEFQNILMSMAISMQGVTIVWKTIRFRPRTSGKNTVNMFNMIGKGLTATREMKRLKKQLV